MLIKKTMKLPPRELLEKTHTFPGHYLFKVVGEVETHFEARLVAALREELSLPSDPAHSSRLSTSGIHCAVSIDVPVESADEVLRLYARIAKLPGLVLML